MNLSNDIEILIGKMLFTDETIDLCKYKIYLKSDLVARVKSAEDVIPLCLRRGERGIDVYLPVARKITDKDLFMLATAKLSMLQKCEPKSGLLVLGVYPRAYKEIQSYDLDLKLLDKDTYVSVGTGMMKDAGMVTLDKSEVSVAGLLNAIKKNLFTRVRAILQKAPYLANDFQFLDLITDIGLTPEMRCLLVRYGDGLKQKVSY